MSRRRYMKRHHKVVPIGKTVLLLHFDGNVTDSSENNYSVTNTGLAFTTGKFGQAIQFGTGYVNLPNDFLRELFTSGTFTIDFWVKVDNSTGDYHDVVFQSSNSSYGDYCPIRMCFRVDNGVKTCVFLSSTNGYTWNIAESFSVNMNDGFNHVALVHYSGVSYFYINGIFTKSFTHSTTPSASQIYNRLGSGVSYNNSSHRSKNVFDEFRISNVARWTTNFTPPTQPYTAD